MVSKINKEYGLTSTALNKLCWDRGVVPIYMHSMYYLDKSMQVYKLIRINDTLEFKLITPYRYSKRHNIPIYILYDDFNHRSEIRLDYLYLSTWYGPMALNTIIYSKYEMFSPSKELYYKVLTGIPKSDNSLEINGIIFKPLNGLENIYLSESGVVYDASKNTIRRKYFTSKFYNSIFICGKGYLIHRLVYSAWKNDGQLLDSEIQIDHIDGFKNHNWIENLREVTNLENFRAAAYLQNLRTTRWTPEIIENLCELMEIGNLGPYEIVNILNSKFPNLNASYEQCKKKIYELLYDNHWQDVKSKYNITNYIDQRSSHNNQASSDELIHKICQAHVSGKYLSNRQIAQTLNTTETIVNKVLRKDMRTDISSQYNITYVSNRRHPINEQEAYEICEAIMTKNIPIHKVAEEFHREKESIRKVIRRQIFPEITSKYNFEEKYPHYEFQNPYSK